MRQLMMRLPDLGSIPEIPVLPPGYTLRTFQERDLESLAALMRASFEDDKWTTARVREALIDAPDVKTTYVIEHEGVVVATASARLLPEEHPGSGYLHWVATDPAHRGQKLGTAAVVAVLHEFRRLGCKDAVLETDDARLPAIRTYQNLGFVPEHRHESHIERWAEVAARLLAAANL